MTIGASLAFGVVYGLFRCFDNYDLNWRWRWRWIAFAVSCGVLGVSFYGWGWTGHPLRVWGLA